MRSAAVGIAILIGVFAGCDGGPTLVPVAGTVTFPDGRPVKGGVVEFSPVAGGASARGAIGANGTFSLTTGDKSGAVVGSHRIVVIQAVVADGAAAHVGAHHAALVVHPKFASYGTSGLSAEIRAGAGNVVPLRIEPASPPKKGW
jgi:hypothetical protein